jgi:ABC-2 type transport system permease protein
MVGYLVIGRKEVKSLFLSPTFYVIATLLTVILSFVYSIQLKQFSDLVQNYIMQPGVSQQQLNIHYGLFLRHLSYLNLLLIFIVPAFTMKLLSEERKLRTFDLLLTSPVTSFDIVFGKFISALASVFALVLIAIMYPIWTSLIVEVQWGSLLVATLGIFLVGTVYAAMNLFCSSLTENSLIAYVMSVILNVSIWFRGMGAEVVDSGSLRAFFEHISLSTHLSSLVEGTVRTSALVFLLSVVILFLFLAERVVESMRWRA